MGGTWRPKWRDPVPGVSLGAQRAQNNSLTACSTQLSLFEPPHMVVPFPEHNNCTVFELVVIGALGSEQQRLPKMRRGAPVLLFYSLYSMCTSPPSQFKLCRILLAPQNRVKCVARSFSEIGRSCFRKNVTYVASFHQIHKEASCRCVMFIPIENRSFSGFSQSTLRSSVASCVARFKTI